VACDTTRAGATLNQPKKLSDVVESVGKAAGGARARQRGPQHRRSNSQTKKKPSATRAGTAGGVHPQQRQRRGKPDHDSETSGEARSLVGGPKHSRSTTHDEKELKPTHDSAAANHGNGVDGRTKRVGKEPTPENYTQ